MISHRHAEANNPEFGKGQTLGLQLRQGSLSAYRNGEQLGVMVSGLSGDFVWAADMCYGVDFHTATGHAPR